MNVQKKKKKKKNYNATKLAFQIKMASCSNCWITFNFYRYGAIFLSCDLQWFMINLN